MLSKLNRWTPALIAMAASLMLMAPSDARATLMLESTQADFNFNPGPGPVVHSIIFVDNNPIAPGTIVGAGQPTANPDGTGNLAIVGADQNATIGQLGIGSTVPAQVGNFLVTASFSTSASPVGQLISGSTSVLNNNSATHSQSVRVGDTNYTSPAGVVRTENIVSGAFSIPGSPGSRPGSIDSIAINHYIGANVQFAGIDNPGGTNIYSRTFSPGVSGPRSYSDDVTTGPFSAPSPYSLTAGFVITLAANNQLTSRSNEIDVLAVPEPATMAAILTGLPLLALSVMRRRRRTQLA